MNEFNFGMGASSSGRSMTVREFLESATEVGELVVVTCGGGPPAPYISTMRTVFACPPISPIERF